MVSTLMDRGFKASPADAAEAATLRAEHISRLAALRESQEEEKRKEQIQRSMIHPGRLVEHEVDLEGYDSRDLRYMERYYSVWSCCGKGANSPGCTLPDGTRDTARADGEDFGLIIATLRNLPGAVIECLSNCLGRRA